MFKKHIATDHRHIVKALEIREQTLWNLFIDKDSNQPYCNGKEKKDPPPPIKAINNFKNTTNIQAIQRNTNTRLAEIEEILKLIFKIQDKITFSNFCQNYPSQFEERFIKLVVEASQFQSYDSDSELASSEKVDKKNIMKLLRLYLRLSTRKKELENISKLQGTEVIKYPEIDRGQKENNYSEVEAYILSESSEKKLVLSKSSYLYQKESSPKLFEEESSKQFSATFITVLREIKTSCNPLNYTSKKGTDDNGFTNHHVDYAAMNQSDPFE